MFTEINREFLAAWHGDDAKNIQTVPLCFTKREWSKYYVAAEFSKKIGSNRKKKFDEEEARSLACEDCEVWYQRRQILQGKCRPPKLSETPIGRIATEKADQATLPEVQEGTVLLTQSA